MCTITNQATATQTLEDKVRQYAVLFDGTKKDFSEVESAFDDLYHKEFVGLEWPEDIALDPLRQFIDKKAKKELDKQRLAAGAKITNLTYTRIDYNKALIQFCLESEGTADESGSGSSSIIFKFLVTIKDKKIIEARQISYEPLDTEIEIIIAYCLSDCHSIRRGYQHGEAAIFKGRSKGLLQH